MHRRKGEVKLMRRFWERMQQVARLVCSGLSNKEIGQILYISDTTVKKHMPHILEKIGCDSRESLTEKVKEQG